VAEVYAAAIPDPDRDFSRIPGHRSLHKLLIRFSSQTINISLIPAPLQTIKPVSARLVYISTQQKILTMKKVSFFLAYVLLLCQTPVFSLTEASDSTGRAGDHFSLQGALEMFRQSASPEDFEKKINEEDNHVNNLDLNGDGEIDYVRVEDKMDGDVHALVLQVPVNEKEVQDIAVIEIEKTGSKNAILQIVGDEDIYGPEVYVEPFEEEYERDGKGGPSADITVARVVVNVWFWPSVRFMYAPGYRVWVSPYRWRVYPGWWRPWRPQPWRWHYNRCAVYRPHYRVVRTHRVVRAHRVYRPYRRTSVTVRTTTVGVKKTNNGAVVKKRTTITTTGANRAAAGRKRTTTTTVKSSNGRVKAGKKANKAAVRKTKRTSRRRGKN
jgi:hypothetical protein